MFILKTAIYKYKTMTDIKIKQYEQEYFQELNDKMVLAYIENYGWIYGLFKYDIELDNYEYMPASFDHGQTHYTRRTDRYSVDIFSKAISSIIWSSKSSKTVSRPFGLEPKFDSYGSVIDPGDRVYHIKVPEIQYLVPETDPDLCKYLKENNIKPT